MSTHPRLWAGTREGLVLAGTAPRLGAYEAAEAARADAARAARAAQARREHEIALEAERVILHAEIAEAGSYEAWGGAAHWARRMSVVAFG